MVSGTRGGCWASRGESCCVHEPELGGTSAVCCHCGDCFVPERTEPVHGPYAQAAVLRPNTLEMLRRLRQAKFLQLPQVCGTCVEGASRSCFPFCSCANWFKDRQHDAGCPVPAILELLKHGAKG